jgi:hypothetical protein
LKDLYSQTKASLVPVAGGRPDIEYFHKRHGSDSVLCKGTLIYSDGATRDYDPRGPMYEPPRDPKARCQLRLMYYGELLSRATEAFLACKQEYTGRASANLREWRNVPPSPPRGLVEDQLLKLKADVKRWQKIVNELQECLDDLKPEWERERQESTEKNKTANESFLASIGTIRI